MPLKLVPPRKGKSPNWTIRGTYLRVGVDESARTPRRSVAAQIKRDLEQRIERGEYPEKAPAPTGPTFLSAAVAYMQSGGERGPALKRLIEYFGETPLPLTQEQVDKAALELLPNVKPVTRNRKVYSPVSAVMRRARFKVSLERPANSKSREKTDFMSPADAQAVIAAADAQDAEFGLLLRFLLYTGVRINEALALRWENTEIEESFAFVRFSKNGDPRALKLRDDLRTALIAHRGDKTLGKMFRFVWGGGFKDRLTWAKLAACGMPRPKRRKAETKEERRIPPHRLKWVTYHTFRHTWATWMRRYGGIDVEGLVATKNWKDARSARRYAHVVPREEWDRVARLPSIGAAEPDESTRGISVETTKAAG